MVAILSERIQYHQFSAIIKCYNFLQVYYLQITQQASVLKSTLQAQTNIYSSLCLHPQTYVTALTPPLKSQHLILKNNIM